MVPATLFPGNRGRPAIWIHAVSLGEIRVAASLKAHLQEMIPGCSLVFSSTTEHGWDLARKTFPDSPVLHSPIDLPFSVRRSLSAVRPDVMVFLETEIWPAWIVESHRIGIKTAMINGRISERSIPKYRRLRPFFREILRHVDAFSMILPEDAARIREMGADPEKIEVNGNAKYELLLAETDLRTEQEMRRALNLGPTQHVFVAGSTREGEEPMVLDVFARIREEFPDMVLVLAPRHLQRIPEIESLIRGKGFSYQLRTALQEEGALRTAPVVLVNTFGELFKLYSVGTINFSGASLVPLGGQNPLEAAAWGKVVFYGPSMEDFLDGKRTLEQAGAGMEVTDAAAFSEKALWLLRHPDQSHSLGIRAREATAVHRGAAKRHARVIARLLENSASRPRSALSQCGPAVTKVTSDE